MKHDDLCDFAKDELAQAEEFRGRAIPDEADPRYDLWLCAEVLCMLVGPTLPVSVQVVMATAAKLLYREL